MFNFWTFFLNNLILANPMFWTDGNVNFSELLFGFYPLLLATKELWKGSDLF